MSGVTPTSASTGVSAIYSMDIETAMLTVQGKRTELLEAQLKEQISAVQQRNEKIEKLNTALSEFSNILGLFDGGAKATDQLHQQSKWGNEQANSYPAERKINSALVDAGLKDLDLSKITDSGGLTNNRENGREVRLKNGVRGDCTKGQIEAAQQKIKSLIDAQSNSQQMDMLRLQSLSNKRNEAFDLMSNTIKKMQDGRSSIISNMR